MFTNIRNLFAELPESKIRGYKAGRFSFNVKGGRCETCQGGGLKVIEMNFLPDVYVHCETCNGKRFNRKLWKFATKGKSISDVLEMTIDEAVDFFQPIPKIYAKVKTLQDVGLGYITWSTIYHTFWRRSSTYKTGNRTCQKTNRKHALHS